ncbi:uncharacterized protein LOC141601582 [Silene latifolia]|uniref:uncharacterized protein LOC141601582 n=1 Tax=Silene latifolia TaxID=37657 RepID=UPI003D78865C
MFCKGERRSIELLLNAFNYFSKTSGLLMNKGKSSFYCNGVDPYLIDEVVKLTGMTRGSVPFKYLGVNVSPKRLSVQDCTCLVDRIVDRIRGLGARKLSYAGRVVLIQSVLSSLHSYWSRIFIIPKTVTNKIEAICRAFLWHGTDNKQSPSLVCWQAICRPRKQGGLGLKHQYAWNVALMGKYVWWIASKADILWVRWVHAVYIKQKSWVDFEPSINSSWSWLKICQDRLVRMQITHQNRCFFCGAKEEDNDHLFFQCVYSLQCLGLVSAWCKTQIPENEWISWWVKWRQRSASRKQILALIISCLVYRLWQMRNNCRLEGVLHRPEYLVLGVKQEVRVRLGHYKFKCTNVSVLRWMTEISAC